MNKINLAIVIPYYDGQQFIDKCLRSIYRCLDQQHVAYSIYVIDNCDKSNLKLTNPKVHHIITNKKKIGFARAVNIGIGLAMENCEQIFLLNQDTILHDNINGLFRTMSQYPEISILAPYITSYDGSKMHPAFENKTIIPAKKTDKTGIYITSYLAACATLIRSSIINNIGFFDPVFYHFYEDDDFFCRAQKADLSIHIYEASTVGHYESSNQKDRTFQTQRSAQLRRAYLVYTMRYKSNTAAMLRGIKSIFLSLLAFKNPIPDLQTLLYLWQNQSDINNDTMPAINKRAFFYMKTDLPNDLKHPLV